MKYLTEHCTNAFYRKGRTGLFFWGGSDPSVCATGSWQSGWWMMDKIKAILDDPLHNRLRQMSSSAHQGAKWSTSRTHLCLLPLHNISGHHRLTPPQKTFLPFTSIQQKIMIALAVWNESLNITKLQHKVTQTHTHQSTIVFWLSADTSFLTPYQLLADTEANS